VKKRGIKVAGVIFIAEGPGRYFSKCGRYGIFHMFAGTAEHQWELYEIDKNRAPADMIDYATTLGEIARHAREGSFAERSNFKLEGAT